VPVKLEGVGTVAMRSGGLEVLGQVDDLNGLEGALLHADTTTDAQLLGDGGELVLLGDFDAELAHLHHGARPLALLPTFLGLAFVAAHDGNTRELVSLVLVLSCCHLGEERRAVDYRF
jgi:hypothetical protein